MKISNDIINNQESASKSPQKSPKNSTKSKVKISLPKLKLPKKSDTAHSNSIQNLIQRIPSLEGKSKAVKIGVIIAMVFLFGTATFLVHAIYSNATQTTQIGKRTGKNASLSSSSSISSSSSSAQSASSASKSDMTSANSVSTSSSAATSSSTVINDTSSSASSSSLSAAAESVQKRISASLPTLSIGSTTLKMKGSVTVTSTGDADQVTTTLASNGHSFATITTADGSDTLSLLPGYQSYVTEHVNSK